MPVQRKRLESIESEVSFFDSSVFVVHGNGLACWHTTERYRRDGVGDGDGHAGEMHVHHLALQIFGVNESDELDAW